MKHKPFWYILGLNLIAVAVVLNIRYDMGVAAFSSVMYAISEIYRISLGTASILCYLIFVAIQCILSRKITLTYALEIPLSFAFGFLTDIYDFLIPPLEFPVWLRVALFLLTMFVTAMGVFLCVGTGYVLTPTEGIVQTISQVFRLPFSAVKNGFDLEMLDAVAARCPVPIIASGGAGRQEDFAELFLHHPGVDAGLAASIFHSKQVEIRPLKEYLRALGVEMRL